MSPNRQPFALVNHSVVAMLLLFLLWQSFASLDLLGLIGPHLAVGCAWPVFALVVFFGHLAPVRREYGAAGRLVALHHGPAGALVRTFVDLLEQTIQSSLALGFFIVQFFFQIEINLVPVFARSVRALALLLLLDGHGRRGHRSAGFEAHPVDALF